MSKKSFIRKLSEHDEKKNLEFELEYLRSLTFEERLIIMRQKSREILKQMGGNYEICRPNRSFGYGDRFCCFR